MVPKSNKVAFEEALNMTGYAGYNVGVFLICSSVIMGMCFELFSVSYLVPASVCELHTTNIQQGFLACIPLAGVIFTSPIWGYLADTRGRKKILIISMTMGFVAGILSTFSPNWIVLSLLKLLSSASIAGAFALSMTILGECTPMAKRSGLVILSTSVFLMSTGSMAVIAYPVLQFKFSYYIPVLDIQFNAWRVLCLIFAFPCLISVLGATFIFESPKYLLSIGREKEAVEVLRRIYVMNTGKSGDTFEVDAVYLEEDSESTVPKGFFGSLAAKTGPLLRKPLLKNVILLSVLFVLCYICINSFVVWLPFIINAIMTSVSEGNTNITACNMIELYQNSTTEENQNLDCSMNSFAMIMVFVIHSILAVSNIIMSALINVIGRKKIFIGIQMVAGVAALSVNSSPYWMLTGVLFMFFLTGIFNFGFLSTYSVDIFPTFVRAMAVSLTLMVGRASAVIGINVLKQLLNNYCEYIFYTFGVLSCLGGIIGFLLPSEEKIFGQHKAVKP
ncbi:unnamed protein product [Arctia plantaginis]|uniref:Major facilitator superfamily (MFS) profile domain-containing protein n=1 Tax=Arctia plantaginis TaxID=874455 RepID=A0A8S0ZT10_ARCPL|nr:unnamed protein product [Arctia plantaginis]CAB3235176.1 unnamed protein product [Arctia plantaginis]